MISLRRQVTLLMEYSDSPERKSLRVTMISLKPLYSAGPRPSSLSKTREASAMPVGWRLSLPLKITSSMRWPRKWRALCSPMTHLRASTTFDLPQPLGPTMEVIPGVKSKSVLWAKDLNPTSSRRFRRMPRADL